MFSRRSALFALALTLAAPGVLASAPAFADDVVVLAAASMKNALDDVVASYQEKTGKTVKVS
jgi:molybdate transport system substrate-binding protein